MDSQSVPKPSEKQYGEDAGRYFRYMSEFVGFGPKDAEAIRETALIVEKHMPAMIGNFYTNLLQYPPTRKFFLKKDGTVDDAYLELRMYHQSNFWRRVAGGVYDDDFARFVDYVGRAHTSHGADPHVYIAERYVIGMVGFVQHAIIEALNQELHDFDTDLENRAIRAWNKICMVILEMLARAYGGEREAETFEELLPVDPEEVLAMSVDSYEKSLGIRRLADHRNIVVAREDEIPEGERKIVEVDGISIGVFHHKSNWYALRNSCLHRGGPVATGKIVNNAIICPWHGYTYDVTTGRLLMDPSAKLEMYPVTVQDGKVSLRVPVFFNPEETPAPLKTDGNGEKPTMPTRPALKANEFFVAEVKPGQIKLVHLDGQEVAVYNVGGAFYATQGICTHAGGPLYEGELEGKIVTCPWHFSCFDVTSGAVTCKPATRPLQTMKVSIEGEVGRVGL